METKGDPKQTEAAFRALVEMCERMGMRDNATVVAARAHLPAEPAAEAKTPEASKTPA